MQAGGSARQGDVFDVLERDRTSGMPLLDGQHLARRLDRITSLEQCDDHLGACVFPSWIPDRDEVGVAPHTDAIKHFPRRVEQRVVRMGGRKRRDKGLLACPPPTLLREQQVWVRFAPPQSALALSIGVRSAPVAEVVGGMPPEATVRLAALRAATFRVSSPIPGLAIAGAAPTGLGVVALTGTDLVDAQAQPGGELSSARVTALSRHDLRRWAASHGRTPVGQPRTGGRASSRSGRWGANKRADEAGRAVWGGVRSAAPFAPDRLDWSASAHPRTSPRRACWRPG